MNKDLDSGSDDFGKLSNFNSAGLINSTLSNLKLDFFRHYRDGKYLSANADLDCIWTILGGEKDIIGSNAEVEYDRIELEIVKAGSLTNGLEIKGFGKVDDDQLKKYAIQKKVLIKKSLFLNRLQNKQGKGTAYPDEDEGDFD